MPHAKLKDGTRFFYGLKKELVLLAHSQDLAKLVGLEWRPESRVTTLCVYERPDVAPEAGGTTRKLKPGHTELAWVHTTSSGRVFGLVGIDAERDLMGVESGKGGGLRE